MSGKQLWGYYPTTPEWLPVKVDSQGRLLIDRAFLGGKPGLNVETLTGNKTLTPGTDKIYQMLTINGTFRTVTLDTASAVAGDWFVIINDDDYDETAYIGVKQGAATIEYIYAQGKKRFMFDGTNWRGIDLATGETLEASYNVALGYRAVVYGRGFALGGEAQAYNFGVAVGRNARAYDAGIAIGDGARGFNYGLAMGTGADTNNNRYAFALGYHSEATRVTETAKNLSGSAGIMANHAQAGWYDVTEDNTPAEIYLGRYGSSRFTIKENSALAFKIKVVARDDTADEVAMYTFEGLIKRDGANNTTLAVCNKTVVYEDDATWDCAVTADDANEALIITVTGDADNDVRWAAVLDGVEVNF